MILLGITGAIKHGKTSLADAIQVVEPLTEHFESGLIITDVVNAMHAQLGAIPEIQDTAAINNWLRCLPGSLLEYANCQVEFSKIELDEEAIVSNPLEYQKLFEHLEVLRQHPELAEQQITADNKATFRPILQWVGGYVIAKTHGSIWFDEVIRRAKTASEAGAKVCVAGGLRFPAEAVSIHNSGGHVIKVYRPNATEQDITDPTERERSNIVFDTLVVNDGSLEDLLVKATGILVDAANGQLATEY